MTVGIWVLAINSRMALRFKSLLILCLLIVGVFQAPILQAQERQYLSNEEFIQQSFADSHYQKKTLWVDKQIKTEIEALLDHPYSSLRIHYFTSGDKSAWILDEIGKVEAITTGIVINNGEVESVRVLEFRESRGAEVHRQVFTRQYSNARLKKNLKLDRRINGISGATLSVNALNRQVRMALFLDYTIKEEQL